LTAWHAVVPIKSVAERKTRLREALSRETITELTDRMVHHVLDVLSRVDAIGTVSVLAAEPLSDWQGRWIADPGAGLNAALAVAATAVPDRLVIMHADLPGLHRDDVAALIVAAETGAALAPDRRGTGTNAMALRDARGAFFGFGSDSFARHCAAYPRAGQVRRAGLALDIDLPDDLALAIARGHVPDLD
jgi:2-phospho-L-lactate guanylyltransferase